VSGNGQAARPEGDRHQPKDTHSTLPADAELLLPEQITIALAELAGAAREGLLALAVGTGLGVLGSLLDADVEQLVGPKGRRNPDRAAVRRRVILGPAWEHPGVGGYTANRHWMLRLGGQEGDCAEEGHG
jgi:hypothetical protein